MSTDTPIYLEDEPRHFLERLIAQCRSEVRRGRRKAVVQVSEESDSYNLIKIETALEFAAIEKVKEDAVTKVIAHAEPIDRAQAHELAEAKNRAWREEARAYILASIYNHIRIDANKGYTSYCLEYSVAEFLERSKGIFASSELNHLIDMLNLKEELIKLGYDWRVSKCGEHHISWAPKETTPCT